MRTPTKADMRLAHAWLATVAGMPSQEDVAELVFEVRAKVRKRLARLVEKELWAHPDVPARHISHIVKLIREQKR